VKLDPEEIKTIIKRNKGMGSNRPLTKDRPPSYVELRQILTHGETVEKTFYLMLLSSGMRIGELCSIKIQNVYMNENPVRIDIPSNFTKTGERRTTFISNEAKNFLVEWLKIRQGYMQLVKNRTKNLPTKLKIPENDNRLFPFATITAWKRWVKMCKRAGFTERDSQTNRAILHPHGLRKFFRTHMGSKIGVDKTEELLGHEGYLTAEYRRHTDKELAESYLLGMGVLNIFEREIAQDLTDVNAQLKEAYEERERMRAELTEMRITILELKHALPR
jgi:integrase